MKLEWDENKNLSNIAKHGIDFQDACKIFDGFTIDAIDNRTNYLEERVISIGLLDNIAVIIVVHTDRQGVCRIISARPANRKEREYYDKKIQQSFKF